ncbi:hypothetical protein BOX15_Mlig007560g1 [Macrostomum lignano]|uniref:uridine/cytidine kinase n=2 Tax=Macrostomum lignano TaxID=282301 RepID=A0A1I8IBK2_9PLAT|nr:hypothetical protein BOX15_Mlig020046g1 [Macrostomum lignano]PAA74508.1 hypothetical protein BOX15_Mlig007560g1 [Macrostomum lignano]
MQERKRTILIGVAGGSSSGKTSVCEQIMKQISEVESQQNRVDVISMSSFYRELTSEEQLKAKEGLFDFDHPDAFDFDQLHQTLSDVRSGKTVSVPLYNKAANQQDPAKQKDLALVDVLLVEGILLFYCSKVRDLLDVKLFVDCDSDTRLARRVRTDLNQGRDLETVLQSYTRFVKPAFEEFCQPTKKYADLILPRGADNSVAVDIMALHVRDCVQGAGASGQPGGLGGGGQPGRRQRSLQRHLSESTNKLQAARPH